jgi:hypothetical protein
VRTPFAIVAALIFASGCSQSDRYPTGPSSAVPTGTAAIFSLADEPAIGNPANSCGNDAPGRFTIAGSGQFLDDGREAVIYGAVRVANAVAYPLEVQRYETTNEWKTIPVKQEHPETTVGTVYPGKNGDRLRARLGARTACGVVNWTPFVQFSIARPVEG